MNNDWEGVNLASTSTGGAGSSWSDEAKDWVGMALQGYAIYENAKLSDRLGSTGFQQRQGLNAVPQNANPQANAAATMAAPSSGSKTPGWMLPAALIGGAVVLVLALKR
jgi:hypothetical protein